MVTTGVVENEWEAQVALVQSCIRQLERKLRYAAIAVDDDDMAQAVLDSCRGLEDDLLTKLHDYAQGAID